VYRVRCSDWASCASPALRLTNETVLFETPQRSAAADADNPLDKARISRRFSDVSG
jgi:hypothetical protein